MNNIFLLQSSPWWIPACLLVGAIYAFFLYRKASIFGNTPRTILAIFRGVSASMICLLLLELLLRQIENRIEKKTFILALDTSTSLASVGKSTLVALQDFTKKLTDEGFEVVTQTLENEPITSLDNIQFNFKSTDLSALLDNAKANSDGRNITDVLLVSDGIANQGQNPSNNTYPYPVHSLALGDTTPARDVLVKAVMANQLAYLGNKFQIQADILASGFSGNGANVSIRQNDKILSQQAVRFTNNNALQTVSFMVDATSKGIQKYSVEVSALPGERTLANNRRDVYVEVVDGRQNILMLALSPHPDVKAIRAILEKNENLTFDFQVINPNNLGGFEDKKYDLLILHQLPDYFNSGSGIIKKLLDKGTPVFWILANQSGTAQFNGLQQAVQVLSQPGQTDQVSGYFNKNFNRLNLDPARIEILKRLSPLTAPFGEVKPLANTETILFQRKGSIETARPLLMLHSGQRKSAILCGEGLWQWRLDEYALTEKQEVVDELIMKVIQAITARDDKRKLRVFTTQNVYQLEDRVAFEAETYNEIYEKTFGQNISISLKNEKGQESKYSLTNKEGGSRLEMSGLKTGVYRYTATAKIQGKEETSNGEFVVKDEPLEALTTTADHNLLRTLSAKTGGIFLKTNHLDDLLSEIVKRKTPDKITSTEDFREGISLKWLFFGLLVLLTAEWGYRKYLGGY